MLINSDIEVTPGWLQPLVEWMDTHPQCGVCGPKLHRLGSPDFEYAGAAGGYLDRYGYPFCRGRVLKRTEEDRGQYDSARNLMWVSGACLMTRASLWKQLGGLDNRFFAHMEEIDYCWRAQLAGCTINNVASSVVYHLGGGTLPQDSPFKLQLNYRNNLLMLGNNLAATVGAGKARRIIFTRKVLDGCSAMVYLLQGKPACFKAVIKAHQEAKRLGKDTQAPSGKAEISGYWDICIILQSMIRGAKIFNYIRSYENNH